MDHTPTTVPSIVAIDANPATGSIGGFRVSCPACAFTFTTSLRTIAELDGREHVGFMLRKESEARTSRFPTARLGLSPKARRLAASQANIDAGVIRALGGDPAAVR